MVASIVKLSPTLIVLGWTEGLRISTLPESVAWTGFGYDNMNTKIGIGIARKACLRFTPELGSPDYLIYQTSIFLQDIWKYQFRVVHVTKMVSGHIHQSNFLQSNVRRLYTQHWFRFD